MKLQKLAREKGFKTEYRDAEKDIVAAVQYLNEKYKKENYNLFGSSCTLASLALKIAKENEGVGAVIVFSPAEYFDDKTFCC